MQPERIHSLLAEEAARTCRLEQTRANILAMGASDLQHVFVLIYQRLGELEEGGAKPQKRTGSGLHKAAASPTFPLPENKLWARVTAVVYRHPGGIGVDDVAKTLHLTAEQAYNALYLTHQREGLVAQRDGLWYPTQAPAAPQSGNAA